MTQRESGEKKARRCNESHQNKNLPQVLWYLQWRNYYCYYQPKTLALSSWLRSTSLSWLPTIKRPFVTKPLLIASNIDFLLVWEDFPVWSSSPAFGYDFQNALTGQLTLRGLFHQKIYITKFMAAYANVTILRWVTGRCSMARAMHCITNHDVCSRTSDLASQSLFPLSLIWNGLDRHGEQVNIILYGKIFSRNGYKGLSSSWDVRWSSLVSLELRSRRWNPPNPCVLDHRTSNYKLVCSVIPVLNSLLLLLAACWARKNCLIA